MHGHVERCCGGTLSALQPFFITVMYMRVGIYMAVWCRLLVSPARIQNKHKPPRAFTRSVCKAYRIKAQQQVASSRAVAEKSGFWPLGDENFLDDEFPCIKKFDVAARIQAACNMNALANDAIKLLPNGISRR